MKRRSLAGAALGLAAALALSGAALAFTGVSNGSFEAGTYTDNGQGFQTLPAGATNITGWTIGGSGVDWIGSLWKAADGTMSLDLNALAPGSVSQTFATSVGKTYTVSFSLSGNPVCDLGAKTMTVNATGGSTPTYTFNTATAANTLANMGWVTQKYTFTATSASTTLTFTSTTPSSACGPAIDKVVVTETSKGGAANTAACKKDGWKTMTDANGKAFKNQGDCVSYFASGGRNLAAGTPVHGRQPK